MDVFLASGGAGKGQQFVESDNLKGQRDFIQKAARSQRAAIPVWRGSVTATLAGLGSVVIFRDCRSIIGLKKPELH